MEVLKRLALGKGKGKGKKGKGKGKGKGKQEEKQWVSRQHEFHLLRASEVPMTKLGRLVNDGKINNLEVPSKIHHNPRYFCMFRTPFQPCRASEASCY